MPEASWIAVDAMGGDEGVAVMLAGVARARRQYDGMRFLLVGDQDAIRAGLERHPNLTQASEVVHASQVVTGTDKPSQAIRRAKTTSMGIAVDLVKRGRAAAAVSAGNTGALMALAKVVLRTMPGVDRPALAAIGPSARGDVVLLDLGANVTYEARNLVEFAVMGDAFARAVLGLTDPTIGLLNVGSEELKGDERVRQAAEVLRDSHLAPQFHGFVEGHDITRGTVDVVVTDGFTGNIALKTGEGAMKLMRDLLKEVFTSSVPARLGYVLARPALDRLREFMDPRRYNGAVLVGLNGVVVKSHGGTDAEGFAHAVDVAMDMVTHRFNERIRAGMAQLREQAPLPEPAPPSTDASPPDASTPRADRPAASLARTG
jgi:phosphate acyltransferase